MTQGLISLGIGAVMGAAGLWKSLSPGNSFSAIVRGMTESIQKSLGSLINGIAKAGITYLQQNAGSMFWRLFYKWIFTKPWELLKVND